MALFSKTSYRSDYRLIYGIIMTLLSTNIFKNYLRRQIYVDTHQLQHSFANFLCHKGGFKFFFSQFIMREVSIHILQRSIGFDWNLKSFIKNLIKKEEENQTSISYKILNYDNTKVVGARGRLYSDHESLNLFFCKLYKIVLYYYISI